MAPSKIRINSSDIVLETEGDVGGGIGGLVLAGVLQGAGISTVGAQADTPGNFSERRRYAECATICQKIEQVGKTASAARSLWWPPLRHLFRKHPGRNSAPTAARLMRAASSARAVEASCKSLDCRMETERRSRFKKDHCDSADHCHAAVLGSLRRQGQ